MEEKYQFLPNLMKIGQSQLDNDKYPNSSINSLLLIHVVCDLSLFKW